MLLLSQLIHLTFCYMASILFHTLQKAVTCTITFKTFQYFLFFAFLKVAKSLLFNLKAFHGSLHGFNFFKNCSKGRDVPSISFEPFEKLQCTFNFIQNLSKVHCMASILFLTFLKVTTTYFI